MPRYWQDFRGVADPDDFQVLELTARDGYRLTVYECGDAAGPACLIMPPPGVPFLAMARLALALGRRHRVVGWETRGSPFMPQEGAAAPSTMEDHALDVGEIAAAKGIARARAVTWCESFNLLPLLRRHTNLAIPQAANLSPAVYEKRHPTAVSLANDAFLEAMTAGDEATAREYYDNYRMLREITSAGLAEAERTVARLLALPLDDFASAMRFAALCRHFQEGADRRLSVRTANDIDSLFLHCQDDNVMNYKATLAFFNRLRRGSLVLNKSGGHTYLFHQAGDLARQIGGFFHEGR